MTIEETTGAGTASRLSAGLERFEAWWEAHGQFCRAGGGDYEKTFAFRTWAAANEERESDAIDPMNETYLAGYRAGVAAEREACAKVCADLAEYHATTGRPVLSGVAAHCEGNIRKRSNRAIEALAATEKESK